MKWFTVKRIILFAVILFVIIVPVVSQAVGLTDFMEKAVYELVIWPFINILNASVYILVQVAQYNNFNNEGIVVNGWTTTRDIANMFFVLIMLVVAIGTIVKWQKINYRENLRRLVIMALLVNFSRTIVVFFIDFSQAIMLTFIHAVQDALQLGVISLLGLDQVIAASFGPTISLVAFFIAGVMVIIATILIVTIILVLIMRIIALWMLIIFAPLAFVAAALPQASKYYDQWWDHLGKNLTSGPILAFMLWLTFSIVSANSGTAGGEDIGGIATGAIIRYIVGIGLLTYAIRMSFSLGSVGGSIVAGVGGFALGRVTATGKKLAIGKSGRGGAVGAARSTALGLATRPLATLGGTLPGRGLKYTFGKLEEAGRFAAERGGKRVEAAGATGRAQRLLGRAQRGLGSAVAEVSGGLGGRYARGVRESFDSADNAFARAARRTARMGETSESRNQRARVEAEAKSMDVKNMSESQLADVLKTYSPLFTAKRAAVSRELMERGSLDKYLKTEGKTDEQIKRDKAFADSASRHVFEESGLSPEEKNKLHERNLRLISDDETQAEVMKTSLTEGKGFSRSDLLHGDTARKLTRHAKQTLTSAEFKKFRDKLPRESRAAAAEGLRDILRSTRYKGREEFEQGPSGDQAHKEHRETVDADVMQLRKDLVTLDSKNIRLYASDLKIDASGSVDFDSAKPFNRETLKTLANSVNMDQISGMDPETLRMVGEFSSGQAIIKAQSDDKVDALRSKALMEGLARSFDATNEEQVAAFRTLWRNALSGEVFRVVINSGYKNPTTRDQYAAAYALHQELQQSDEGRRRDRSAPPPPSSPPPTTPPPSSPPPPPGGQTNG